MFNSTPDQSKNTEYRSLSCSQLIATGVIVHDSKRARSAWLRHLWQSFMHYLLRGDEPRIWQKCNDAGDVFYHGYDPRSKQRMHCATETEMRAWLDQLPYC